MSHHPLVHAHVRLMVRLFLPDGFPGKGEKHVFKGRFVYGNGFMEDPVRVEQRHDGADMLFGVLQADVHFLIICFSPGGNPGFCQGRDYGSRIGGFDRHDVSPDPILEVFWGIEGNDLPVIDDGDPVAEPVRFIHVVRGEDDRDPLLLCQGCDILPEVVAGLGVQPERWFVKEKDRRVVEKPRAISRRLRIPPENVFTMSSFRSSSQQGSGAR